MKFSYFLNTSRSKRRYIDSEKMRWRHTMKNMKKVLGIIFFSTVTLALTFDALSSGQTAGELFERALYAEEAKGDLQEAIDLYQEVLKKYPENREVAAKAQLHIGLCYEKLGLMEAPKAYQKVVEEFPEQVEAVKVAKERLSILLKAQSAIEKADKEFNLRKIWSGPLTDTLGAPSPDGKYLSIVDWSTGDLAVRDLSTGKNRRLTHKGSWAESSELALFSGWSPDGKKIVYNWLNKEECFELRIVGVDDPKPQILYPVGKMEYVHPFEWSPDGNSVLALVTRAPNISRVGLISVADGSFRVLKTTDMIANNLPLFTFSPDGKYIAFSFLQDEDTQNRDIFLMSVDDKHETLLIDHPMNDSLLGWSPDGKWILFASNRTGSTDAWVIRVDQGKPIRAPEMIKKDLGYVEPMGFTRNGSFIYGVSNQMTDVYEIDIDPDSGKIQNPPAKASQRYEGSNRSPDYSPDGKYLAYVSTRGPRPIQRNVLCIRNIQTGEERELDPEQIDFNYPRWSPDGRFISVEGKDTAGKVGLYRIDVQTGAVDPILQVDFGVEIYSHRWSKDGKSIFYTRSDPDAEGSPYSRSSHVYVHDISSGKEEVLPGSPNDAKDIDISPDGRWIALLNRTAKRVLRVIPSSGGEPRILHSFEDMTNAVISPAWIAGGKYVLFHRYANDSLEEESKELVRIPAEGGDPQRLGLEMAEFRHFSVHPDGQQVAFHSRGSKMRWPEVWVMENFLPKEK